MYQKKSKKAREEKGSPPREARRICYTRTGEIMKILRLFLLLFLSSAVAACGAFVNEADATLLRLDMTLDGYLNTSTAITVYHPIDFDAASLREEIEQFLQEADVIYSAYAPGSEMYRVNQIAYGQVVEISDLLTTAIQVSLEYAELSNGLFDPTILPLVLLWGIDGSSFFLGGRIPTQEEIDAVLPLIDYRQVELDVANQTVTYLKPGIQLDLGGFSKGFVTAQIVDLLIDKGIEHAMINIGSSSQMTIGSRVEPLLNSNPPRFIPQTEAWRIGTKDPFDPISLQPSIVGIFGLSNLALSSSGSSQQYFEQGGRRYHHLFDPFTGFPVDNELIVVQVISDDPVGIDPLSTLVYLLGLEEGYRLVESLPGVEAVFITYDKRIFTTSGFGGFDLRDTSYRLGSLTSTK
jgi:thiamine biosynthesis lipoprotein